MLYYSILLRCSTFVAVNSSVIKVFINFPLKAPKIATDLNLPVTIQTLFSMAFIVSESIPKTLLFKLVSKKFPSLS